MSGAPATRLAGRGAVALLVALVLAGCQGGAPGEDPAKLHQQADAALARWAKAVAAAGAGAAITSVGELTGQIGDWELAVGDNNKRALMAGVIGSDGTVSDEAPPDGEIKWRDRTSTWVPLLAAQQAIVAIATAAGGTCQDCVPLLVTDARLTSGPIETTKGPATAPIWEFTIKGTTVKVARVAIANPVTVVPPAEGTSIGLAIDSASGTVSGRQLTVKFVGAPDPANKPCGEDYTGEAVESDLAVVVIVTRHAAPMFFGGCSAVGAYRTTIVELAAALGTRAVLDVQRGMPVPVALTP